MNSLCKEHLIRQSPEKIRCMAGSQTCWEFLECAKVLCPAHGKHHLDCWIIPRTHCGKFIGEDFYQKMPECLNCTFFKAKGECYSNGWNYFLAHQMQRYNLKALEELYQKEESFVEILDRLPDGLFTTDRDWRITYFNPAAEKITGFSAYDAVGMYCKDVFKNTICETDCALKWAAEKGSDIHNREYEITNIRGEKIPIICSTSVFRDRSGRVSGGLEIFKDITELKNLHEELSRRERKYRRIFEDSHDMIFSSNQRGRLLDVNPAGVQMLKYASKEALLKMGSAKKFYRYEPDRDKFIEAINRQGYVKDYEVDFKRSDGAPLHVLISGRRYENSETGDIEYEGIIKDITRRKEHDEVIRQRNRELSILNSVAVSINDTLDLKHILMVTLKSVLKVLNLERGVLFLIDRQSKTVDLRARTEMPALDSEQTDSIVFKDSLLMRYLVEEDAILTPQPTFPSFQVRYKAVEGRRIPWLSCFLITFKGKPVGFFGFDLPESRVLSHHEMHLLGSLGNYLGGAIENTQLVKTIGLHRQELRRLTEKLFHTQEAERRRIARELHDEAGQALTAVKLGLDRLEDNVNWMTESLRGEINKIKKLNLDGPSAIFCLDRLYNSLMAKESHLKEDVIDIRRMIARTSSEIRQLSYRLHPTLLSDLGLEPALNLYFKEVSNHSDLDIEFRMVGFDQRLDPDLETTLYRFSQEALTNTLKHSGAELFRLSIIKSYPRIIFRAEDDGIGFDGKIRKGEKMSLGLLGMRERASLSRGTFQIRSKPGEGTRIRIEIPLPEAQSHESSHTYSDR